MTPVIWIVLMDSQLLDWPYSNDPKIRCYAKMLHENYEAMQREEERDGDTPPPMEEIEMEH